MSTSNGDGARGRDEALIERSRLVLAKVGGSSGGPGAQVVGASGRQPGPLGCGTSVRAELATFGTPPLRPASGRVFPGLRRPYTVMSNSPYDGAITSLPRPVVQ